MIEMSATFALASIPTMIVLGLRHALDVDHITAIDNLVRLHNAERKSRWVGAGFSFGHMASVLIEMVFMIYLVAELTGSDSLQLSGAIVSALALGILGSVNLYSMKKYGKTGSAIFVSKLLARTRMAGPFGSAFISGAVFGLGFDTATQISAITLSAVTSATAGVQTALTLAGFFALGMIPTDTLDSVLLRSAFHKIFATAGFRYMSYALSGSALTVASIESYSVITRSGILPEWTGVALSGGIIATSFAYAFARRKSKMVTATATSTSVLHEHQHNHVEGDNSPHIHLHKHLHTEEKIHQHEHQYESDIGVTDGKKKDKDNAAEE